MILIPGDVLLYKAQGLYGRLIAIKTWHPIAHVEIYIGDGRAVASRDGLGTGTYPVRMADLACVCRAHTPYNVQGALRWFRAQPHRPYGWLDLLQFIGLNITTQGIICSAFATEFLRAGGMDPFNGEPACKIAPFEFALADEFQILPFVPGVLFV